MWSISHVETLDLAAATIADIRDLLDVAFGGDFEEEDWDHACGGTHLVASDAAGVVGHAAVVTRTLDVANRSLTVGYVEAVATEPERQRRGIGTTVMRAVADVIRGRHDMGALATGSHRFYERLGWERWRGSTHVRHEDGRLERTRDDDGGIMVLRFGVSSDVDLDAPIACAWRSGDVW